MGRYIKARGGVTYAYIIGPDNSVIATGTAVCLADHMKGGKLVPGDPYVKAEGRRLALYRALEVLGGEGVECIRTARVDQLTVHGWDAEHDDAHDKRQLLRAAEAYILAVKFGSGGIARTTWPWGDDSFHVSPDPVGTLAKAGAMIAAEIDRILRARQREAARNALVGGRVVNPEPPAEPPVNPPEPPVMVLGLGLRGIARQNADVDEAARNRSAARVLAHIEAIVNEPLDEREGHGPTRVGQFARIEGVLRKARRP